MIARILTAAVLTGFMFSVAAPAAYAAGAPKTKAACEKMKDMKWDAATKKCVKK